MGQGPGDCALRGRRTVERAGLRWPERGDGFDLLERSRNRGETPARWNRTLWPVLWSSTEVARVICLSEFNPAHEEQVLFGSRCTCMGEKRSLVQKAMKLPIPVDQIVAGAHRQRRPGHQEIGRASGRERV